MRKLAQEHQPFPPKNVTMPKQQNGTGLVCAAVLLLLSLQVAAGARRLLVEPNGQAGRIETVGVRSKTGCEPFEVHLALADRNTDIRVSWRTYDTSCGSTVTYGALSPAGRSLKGSLQSTDGSTWTLTESLMCEGRARSKAFQVVMHTAVMTDLNPDTLYTYTIDGGSRSFVFRSPQPLGGDASTARFSFIAFGDMGESRVRRKAPLAAQTVSTITSELVARPTHLLLHVGDLAYADGRYKAWDSFMGLIEPVASSVPYMVGIGNHESGPCKAGNARDPSGEPPYAPEWGNYGGESGGECGAMAAYRFPMPGSGVSDARIRAVRQGQLLQQQRTLKQRDTEDDVVAAAAANGNSSSSTLKHALSHNPPFWYSFEYGSVHFTVISTEHDLQPGSTQHEWLVHDLASADRCRTPWLVVGLHRPMYVVYPHKDNRVVGDHIRDAIEDVLVRYDVDLTIAGHVHTYYRSCTAYAARCTNDGGGGGLASDGITHFVIGSAGHELSDVEDDQKDWCATVVGEHGFGRFDVDGDRLTARFIRSADGSVADSVVLRSKVDPQAACAGGPDAVRGGGAGSGSTGSGSESGSGRGGKPIWVRRQVQLSGEGAEVVA